MKSQDEQPTYSRAMKFTEKRSRNKDPAFTQAVCKIWVGSHCQSVLNTQPRQGPGKFGVAGAEEGMMDGGKEQCFPQIVHHACYCKEQHAAFDMSGPAIGHAGLPALL